MKWIQLSAKHWQPKYWQFFRILGNRNTANVSPTTVYETFNFEMIVGEWLRNPNTRYVLVRPTGIFWDIRMWFRHMTSLGQVWSELNLSLNRFILVIRKSEISLYLRYCPYLDFVTILFILNKNNSYEYFWTWNCLFLRATWNPFQN